MFAQERSNKLLFRARQVAPDTTDDTTVPGVYATEASGSGAPPVPMEDSQMENLEEEEPTSDAEILENDSNTREGELTGIIKHLRDQVNEALAFEHYEDATDIQTTLTAVLEAANFSPHLTLDMQEGSLEHIRDFTGEPETEVIMRCQEFTRRLQKICIGFCEQ